MIVLAEQSKNCEKAMNQAIEIFDGIGMKVVDNVKRILSSYQLIFLHRIRACHAQLPTHQVTLEHIVVLN